MSVRLRVAMVTPFPEDPGRIVGGVAGVARYLAPALADEGRCDLTIVAMGAANARVERLGSVPVHYLAAVRGPGFLTYWTRERMLAHEILRALRPDVVHFQGVGGWGIGCPWPRVLTLHGVAEKDALYSSAPLRRTRSRFIGRVERYARSQFRHVISISPYLMTEVGAQLRGRVWPIENPVDDAYFGVRRSPASDRILFLGRVTERKNVLTAISALARLRGHPAAQLRVGGDGGDSDYAAACRALATKLGVAGRVEWLGSLSADRVRREFETATCLLLPSYQETAPLVIEEAMAAGVPVVASSVCGIPHLVSDERTGLLVPADDAEKLAESLGRILGSPELQSRMGEAGRAEAGRRFRAAHVARATVTVYEAALAEARR
jgi:glycosyltransferase involved in cell wall biosynthesis